MPDSTPEPELPDLESNDQDELGSMSMRFGNVQLYFDVENIDEFEQEWNQTKAAVDAFIEAYRGGNEQ